MVSTKEGKNCWRQVTDAIIIERLCVRASMPGNNLGKEYKSQEVTITLLTFQTDVNQL